MRLKKIKCGEVILEEIRERLKSELISKFGDIFKIEEVYYPYFLTNQLRIKYQFGVIKQIYRGRFKSKKLKAIAIVRLYENNKLSMWIYEKSLSKILEEFAEKNNFNKIIICYLDRKTDED